MKKRILTIFFLLFASIPLSAQNTSIGFCAGQWQPHSIELQKTVSLFAGNAETTPYFSLIVTEGLAKTIFLKQSIGFWKQKFVYSKNVRSVTLVPVTAAIKHRLVSDSFFMPCVSYGAGLLFGIPKKEPKTTVTPPKSIGIDIFVATGFDIAFSKAIGFHMDFSYHYAKFSSNVGDTDDFTGPQAILGLYYGF